MVELTLNWLVFVMGLILVQSLLVFHEFSVYLIISMYKSLFFIPRTSGTNPERKGSSWQGFQACFEVCDGCDSSIIWYILAFLCCDTCICTHVAILIIDVERDIWISVLWKHEFNMWSCCVIVMFDWDRLPRSGTLIVFQLPHSSIVTKISTFWHKIGIGLPHFDMLTP